MIRLLLVFVFAFSVWLATFDLQWMAVALVGGMIYINGPERNDRP